MISNLVFVLLISYAFCVCFGLQEILKLNFGCRFYSKDCFYRFGFMACQPL